MQSRKKLWKTGWWHSMKNKTCMHLASVKNDLPVCPFFFGNRKQPFLCSTKLLLSQYPKKGDFVLPQKYLKKKRSLGEILSGSRTGTVLKAPGSTQATQSSSQRKGLGVKSGWHKVFPALSPPVLTPSAKLFAGRLLKLWESCERNRRKTFLASQIHPQRAGCALLPMALWLKSLVLMWL